MKNKKLLIGIVIVVILAVVIYFAWRSYKIKKRQKALYNVKPEGTTPTTNGNGGSSYSDSFPLKQGSRGNNVTALQYAINEGCPEVGENIAVDGIFGPQTAAAVEICLGDRNGHVPEQVSYAEYQWLTKRISFSQEQQIKTGCQASDASRAMMLTFWGIDCDQYGY